MTTLLLHLSKGQVNLIQQIFLEVFLPSSIGIAAE